MNRKVFFDGWRDTFGPMVQAEVGGINAILDEIDCRAWTDPRWIAYVLATAWHETGGTMAPLEEIGRGKGHPYGKPDPETGQAYYGRGFVQLTWRENYARQAKKLGLPLVEEPQLALDPGVAASIICGGMADGDFTGKCLSDYFDADTDDPRNARRIVNGTDKADLIAGYHRKIFGIIETATPTRIDALEARIAALEAQNERLIATLRSV